MKHAVNASAVGGKFYRVAKGRELTTIELGFDSRSRHIISTGDPGLPSLEKGKTFRYVVFDESIPGKTRILAVFRKCSISMMQVIGSAVSEGMDVSMLRDILQLLGPVYLAKK